MEEMLRRQTSRVVMSDVLMRGRHGKKNLFVTRKLFPDPDDLLSREGAKKGNVLHPVG